MNISGYMITEMRDYSNSYCLISIKFDEICCRSKRREVKKNTSNTLGEVYPGPNKSPGVFGLLGSGFGLEAEQQRGGGMFEFGRGVLPGVGGIS